MLRNPPYRILGVELWACHGLPAIVAAIVGAVVGLSIWETASHYVNPITLDAIWAEPRQITVEQIMAQTPGNGVLHLHKTGYWRRLCKTTAYQSFIDEQGTLTVNAIPHNVDVPEQTGEIVNKGRPKGIPIPQDLAMKVKFTGKPAIYRFRIENKSECPWTLFPIKNPPVEATFEIVP